MKLEVVAFDGDDTLWHNEPLFWATQQRFAELLAPFSPADALGDKLYETEIRNLGLFGYGIKGFVLSMIETALEVSGGRVPNPVIQEFLDRGKEMLAHPVHLLDGAAEALAAMRAAGRRTLLVTKGDLFDQEGKLARSGLADLFDGVEIVSEKDPATYARVFARHGADPRTTAMVGNSVRSDILPVLDWGGWAVHVPYATTWAHERADPPEQHPRYRRLTTLHELAGVVAGE